MSRAGLSFPSVAERAARRACLALLGGLVVAGCGLETAYRVDEVEVERRGWDTLEVGVRFVQDPALGGPTDAAPDTVALLLYGADYDTLYTGPGPTLVLDDEALGDREPLMLEVCGRFGGQAVCEQRGLFASPKRVRAATDIAYPDDALLERGRYAFAFEVERLVFGSDSAGAAARWEPIAARQPITGYLQASVSGEMPGTVRVPFSDAEGRFDLARVDGYRDFRYSLRSRLHDEREARVQFEVYAGLGSGRPMRLAQIQRRVRLKTEDDRLLEVYAFVEQATEQLLTRLDVDPAGARAYIDDWTFDEGARRYEIDIDVEWGGSFFLRRRRGVEGRLLVDETGEDAVFVLRDADRRTERRWEDRSRDAEDEGRGRTGLERIDLEDLEPPDWEGEAVPATAASW